MKVLIPVMNIENDKEVIANGFNSSNYICLYNTESGDLKWENINNLSNHSGNLTLKLKQLGVEAVITTVLHPMALGLFIESGFIVYKAISKHLKENLKLFMEKGLLKMTSKDVESSGCHGNCTSCETDCNT